ncbi:hypothetical protein [Hydromonas duriensis]|uniref:Uncharacterized protein n=1 Tax=Hydromonas duriensis TaxID=1527608 RepID=A0A4R6Y0B8_9BURK|nr:hypothetical protein [Hydromonas duriensis]TDR27035.1 hypothetical protein DFR44_1524 [Hydromonas duriensis]
MSHTELKKPEGWFWGHIFSVLFLNFSYESRFFWWGKSDLWSCKQVVPFRFLKLYMVEFLAMSTKATLFMVFYTILVVFGFLPFENLMLGIVALVLFSLTFSLLAAIIDYFSIMKNR